MSPAIGGTRVNRRSDEPPLVARGFPTFFKRKLIVAEKSGHDIHLDQPELVIAAIKNAFDVAPTRPDG
jgi:pimeloyl-ACP methyl ester carboxylesterase